MNLPKYLHTRWAANTTLNGLLPATSLHTGTHMAVDPTFPFATISMPGGFNAGRTNDGVSNEAVSVRIAVYHGADYYDELVAIAEAVHDAFDEAAFDLGGSDRCILMHQEGEPDQIQDERGDWTFSIDFTCRVSKA